MIRNAEKLSGDRKPTVSVLMSVYNGERHLREAVDCILSQAFEDFEFLIINDGSTDATEDILKEYSDSRIRTFTNKRNEGLTHCLINGLKEAQGEFVARMDADDISYPARMEKQVEFLQTHRDHAVVGAQCHFIDIRGRPYAQSSFRTSTQEIREAMRVHNQFAHGSTMFVRDLILECGGYREPFRYAQDYDLWLRVIEKYDMANLSDVLYGSRWHPGSLTYKKFYEQLRFAELAQRLAEMREKEGTDSIMNGDFAGLQEGVDAWYPQSLLQHMKLRSKSLLQLADLTLSRGRVSTVCVLWLKALMYAPLSGDVWEFLSSDSFKIRFRNAVKDKLLLPVMQRMVAMSNKAADNSGDSSPTAWQFHLFNAAESPRRFLSGIDFFRYIEYPAVAERLDLTASPKVLDVGSGGSVFPFFLASMGIHVECVDLFPGTAPEIVRARKGAELRMSDDVLEKIKLVRQDARELSYADEAFDRVSCISMIEYVPADGDIDVAKELSRVLKPGGLIVMTMPYNRIYREAREPYGPPIGHRLYDENALDERIVEPSGLSLREKIYFSNRWFDFENKVWERLPVKVKSKLGPLAPFLAKVFVKSENELTKRSANRVLLVLQKSETGT